MRRMVMGVLAERFGGGALAIAVYKHAPGMSSACAKKRYVRGHMARIATRVRTLSVKHV